MRQLLVLGFYCEVYRREPRCRIYVNDILLDEFDIPHTPRIDTWKNEIQLDPKFLGVDLNALFLKYAELDDASERSMTIRIEIQNNDNNYANGFMTRHTRVMLNWCCLVPIKLWENLKQMQDRWKYSNKNWHKWQNSTNYIAQYYSGARNSISENLMLYSDVHFPDIKQQTLPNQEKKDQIYNHYYHPQMWKSNPSDCWIGSSGHYRLTLSKKLGFWRHSTDRRRGWWKYSRHDNLIDLYDKYKQYEDTRSIDQ